MIPATQHGMRGWLTLRAWEYRIDLLERCDDVFVSQRPYGPPTDEGRRIGWVVRRWGFRLLARSGEWEYESPHDPEGAARREEFIAATRWETPEAAALAYFAWKAREDARCANGSATTSASASPTPATGGSG